VLREGVAAAPRSGGLCTTPFGLAARARASGLHDCRGGLPYRAAELAPDNARFGYVYAVAVKETEGTARAVEVLRSQLLRHPENRDLLVVLVTIQPRGGDIWQPARDYAERLVRARPQGSVSPPAARRAGRALARRRRPRGSASLARTRTSFYPEMLIRMSAADRVVVEKGLNRALSDTDAVAAPVRGVRSIGEQRLASG